MSEIAEEQEEQIEVLEDEIEAEEVDETVDDDQVEDDVDLDGEEQEAEEDSVEITLDDESLTSENEDQSAPKWAKDLRKMHREDQKEKRRLKQELDELKQGKVETPEPVMKKPTLEAFDYDTEKFEGELSRYYQQQRKAEENKAQQDAEQKKVEQEYKAQLDNYEKSKKSLGVKDYDDAEHVVLENFSVQQQNIILNGSDDAALAVYAIGKSDQRTKDLSSIKDPVKFAFAVAKLEGKLKVSKRKATTSPERKVTGSGKKSGVDSTLERLEAESLKTNDRSKIVAYKTKLRAKNRK